MGKLKIHSKALGEIELAEHQIIEMPSGMIGFPSLARYALIPFDDPQVPFVWWQCVDEPSLCFILIDPALICPDYVVNVPAEELEEIELQSVRDASVYGVVTVPADPREMTVNLMGPIIVNQSARKARQLVLADPRYSARHRILHEKASGHACANAQTE
jgi:flagellar assembly factor FliW